MKSSDDSDFEADRPRRALETLAERLIECGLRSSLISDTMLLALNPAVVPERGAVPMCSPGLQQLIACRFVDGTEGLWFWWVWSIADDHSPVETGPLCRAEEVDLAAERVAYVLAVRDKEAVGSGGGMDDRSPS